MNENTGLVPTFLSVCVHFNNIFYRGVISEDIIISQLSIAKTEFEMFKTISTFVDDNELIQNNEPIASSVDIEYFVDEGVIIDYRDDHKKEYLIKDFISQTHMVNSGKLDREQNIDRVYITECFTPKMCVRNCGDVIINEVNLGEFKRIANSAIRQGGIVQFYIYEENSRHFLIEDLKLGVETLDSIRIESEDIKPGDTVLLMEPVQSTGFRYFVITITNNI